MKTALIINPQSGGGRTLRLWPQLEPMIRRFLPDATPLWTEQIGHACALAQQAAFEGADLVIAVGGDGTLNEVVNGLMQHQNEATHSKTPDLGLFPQGTGGDFRRSLGLDPTPASYLQRLAQPHTRNLDIGKLCFLDHEGTPTQRYFVNVTSVGLGGLVDQQIQHTRGSNAQRAYLAASLRALQSNVLAPLHVEITAPHEPTTRTQQQLHSRNLAICNARYFGGGMQIAPHARPDDGLFDIVNFAHPSRLHLVPLLPSLYEGKHLTRAHVQSFRAADLRITLADPSLADRVLLDVDGEALGRLPLRVEMMPSALRLRL